MKTIYTIFHGINPTTKTYGLHVRADRADWKSGKCVSSVSGIATPELCDQRAHEYAASFGATIETPMLCSPTLS